MYAIIYQRLVSTDSSYKHPDVDPEPKVYMFITKKMASDYMKNRYEQRLDYLKSNLSTEYMCKCTVKKYDCTDDSAYIHCDADYKYDYFTETFRIVKQKPNLVIIPDEFVPSVLDKVDKGINACKKFIKKAESKIKETVTYIRNDLAKDTKRKAITVIEHVKTVTIPNTTSTIKSSYDKLTSTIRDISYTISEYTMLLCNSIDQVFIQDTKKTVKNIYNISQEWYFKAKIKIRAVIGKFRNNVYYPKIKPRLEKIGGKISCLWNKLM